MCYFIAKGLVFAVDDGLAKVLIVKEILEIKAQVKEAASSLFRIVVPSGYKYSASVID